MKYVVSYLVLASLLVWGIPEMNRHFRPTVDRLEARAVLDGTVVPAPDEMPNGMDAFAPDLNPPIFADGALIMDINGNLPGSTNYLTGKAPADPDPKPPPDDPLLQLWGVAP